VLHDPSFEEKLRNVLDKVLQKILENRSKVQPKSQEDC
jgi:hypothetical protein